MLKIFNTLTKKKEKFIPINNGKINIYVCGITVYNLCHIGHSKTFINFDVIIRYLRYCGYKVNYVRNITDIEDKIIYYSNKNHESIKIFTTKMIKEMHRDFNNLNLLTPNNEPCTTNFISAIIEFIKKLLVLGHAYIADNGDVIFSIETNTNYGILSHQNVNKLKINVVKNKMLEKKNNSLDFVLWKIAKLNEPSWSSPWGNGRPGWHTECLVMSNKIFGCCFDIHGGGNDLIFPHHENEVAQSICINNKPHANIWMHTGIMTEKNKKISKSVNNSLTIRKMLSYFDAETIRLFILFNHYRSNLNYHENHLKKAKISLRKLYTALLDIDINNSSAIYIEHLNKKFLEAMNDDFNTPKACAILFNIARILNRLKNNNFIIIKKIAITLKRLANVLGILRQNPKIYLNKNSFFKKETTFLKLKQLIIKRNNARKEKNWILADKIRSRLINIGIILKDTLNGTLWYEK